jgi:hypothetical protein
LDSIRNEPASKTIADTEKLLSEYPELRSDLLHASHEAAANPEFEAEGINQIGSEQTTQSLNIALHRAVNQAINDELILPGSNSARINHESVNLDFFGLEEWSTPLFEDGNLPIDKELMLANSETERLELMANVSPEEKEQLLSDDSAYAEFRESVLSDGELRDVELNIIAKGEFDAVDQIRSFVVDSEFTQDELLNTLDHLSPEVKTRLADEYFARYGGLVVDDVMTRATGAETVKIETALQGVQLSPVMTAIRALEEAHGHNSAVDGAVMRVWDWTKQGMDASALQLFPTAIALQNATGEERKELEAQFVADIENFIEATNNHVESQNEAKEQAFNISIMVIAAAASVATGGTSLAVPAKLGMDIGLTASVGAAYKNLVAATFEGDDYDLSEFDDNAVSGAFLAVMNRVDILKVLAEPEGAAVFAIAVKGEVKAAAAGKEAAEVVAARKAASELPSSISETNNGFGNVDNVAPSRQPGNSIVDDVDSELWERSSFTPDESASRADEIAPSEALPIADDVALLEDPPINPDRMYDDIESTRADHPPIVVDETVPPEDPLVNPDRRYDGIESTRADHPPIVVDETFPPEDPLVNADRSYDVIESGRAASSTTKSVISETAAAKSAGYDSATGLRIRYPWGRYALRAATAKGSSRVATPTALVSAETLARREEKNQSGEDREEVEVQEEIHSETSDTAEPLVNQFFTGEEVNINGRIAHRLEDGSYAFVIPEGDTLFVIRNDIATAMGQAVIAPGSAVYDDDIIVALKAANEIGDPDLIYTGNQFIIPVEVINASL